MSDKELRDRYGVNMAPVPATKAYKKPLEHFVNKGIEAFSWILVNDSDNTIVYANTYRGKVGDKWRPKIMKMGTDTLQKKLRGYVEVPVTECPVAS